MLWESDGSPTSEKGHSVDSADTQFQIDAAAAIFAQRMRDDGFVDEGDGTAWVQTPTGVQRVPNN